MMRVFQSCLTLGFALALCMALPAAAKDQSRLLPEVETAQTTTAPTPPVPDTKGTDDGTTTPGADDDTPTGPDVAQPGDDLDNGDDQVNLGEIPDIKSMELTLDIAKRALDVYVLVKTKYAGTDLDTTDNLQDFVDKDPKGKEFEADIKAAGFANVDDWNLAITSVGFAYTAATDDPTQDVNDQIVEIQNDNTLAQDIKDRMIASLKATLPSDNNKKVMAELMKDPAYAEKLKQLDSEEE
ncbi:hypothetical protein [Aestuariivirga sp.]|uniref:hypothetical protein n=1 Tax=Aestuariivirga sp. TaxID=2650926 RepID=UPI0039E2C70F